MKVDSKILPVSINDLRDKYFDDLPLTEEESRALENFDRYRLHVLNAAKNDADFKLKYLKIQAMANLSSYRFFLRSDLLLNLEA
jgi:hypothetical protein